MVWQYSLRRLAPATRVRYAAALRGFSVWCHYHCPTFQSLAADDQDIVVAFHCLEDIFEEDVGGLAAAADLVAALQKTRLQYRFRLSFKTLETRRLEFPAVQAAPMPYVGAYALAHLLIGLGYEAEGILTLLCFCALLRVGEAL